MPCPRQFHIHRGDRVVYFTWLKTVSHVLFSFCGILADSACSFRHDLSHFAAQSVDPARIEFRGRSPHAELLATYQEADIALDTFPYNGGLTTCEALWMGVPVVTCPGETFASRHGLAHLTAAGLPELIAADFDRYVEIAVGLASDLDALSRLRAGLRSRVAASPLCDRPRFAGHFAQVMHEVWRRWCEGGTADVRLRGTPQPEAGQHALDYGKTTL